MIEQRYTLRIGTPDAKSFVGLRVAGGLTPYDIESARLGLAGTFYGVVIEHEGDIIGMGRIIGDGGCTFQITDIVVHPDHQGQGLGHKIMNALSDHISDKIAAGSYINLIADIPADRLYAKYGFVPTAPNSIGMAMRASPSNRKNVT